MHTLVRKKFLLVLFLGLALFQASVPSLSRAEVAELSIVRHGNTAPLTLTTELATTPEQMERGLMFRTALPDKHGMLFVFPTTQVVTFWMKNTRLPLDMLFIRENGSIAQIHKQAVPEDLTPIPSQEPVRYVLEISGGDSDKLGIQPEDTLILPTSLAPAPAPKSPDSGHTSN